MCLPSVRSLVLCMLTTLCVSVRAGDFTVRLGLKHGHIREVFFGCAEKATDGYDRGLDDLAPPPGIETGYTAFIAASQSRMPPFYKDIRGHAERVTWRFGATVYKSKDGRVVKPIEISWDPAALPAGVDFAIQHGEEPVDMRTVSTLTVGESSVLTITASRRTQQASDAGK